MHLVVDIGNTRTKVGLFSNGALVSQRTVPKNRLAESMQISENHVVTRGIVSSVGQDSGALSQLYPQVDWMILDAETPLPFANAYASPHTLGNDRRALVAAAHSAFQGKNVLVIDAGTCVTYDFLRADGTYLGGSIAPGWRMRLQAMHHFTAKLPEVAQSPNVNLVENTTETCLQSGALHGLAAEIDGIISRYQSQFKHLVVVLSGGDTNTLAPLVKNDIFARPNFLLFGLHEILAYNTP